MKVISPLPDQIVIQCHQSHAANREKHCGTVTQIGQKVTCVTVGAHVVYDPARSERIHIENETFWLLHESDIITEIEEA